MSRGGRLGRLVALAGLDEQRAAQALSGQRQLLDDQQQRLTQFRAYREEYRTGLSDNGGQMSAQQAQELRRFLAELDRTITLLEAQVSREAQACEEQVARWRYESRRRQALDEVHARHAAETARHEDAVAQHEVDEISQSRGRPQR